MKFTWKQIVEFLIGPQESGVRAKDSKGEKKPKSKARKAAAKRGRGRPKGSKNKKK